MSAFIGIIEKDYVLIATDTLSTYPLQNGNTELIPRSYTIKTFPLPQYKSAFAITGTFQVGLCYFNYIVESTYGIDIDSLININLNPFTKKITSEYNQLLSGTIYLFGYSNKSQSFKGFKLIFNPKNKLSWVNLPDNCFIFKPDVNDWEKKLRMDNERNERFDTTKFIIDLMKIQKAEEMKKDLKCRVGIGGQILLTQLGFETDSKTFTINTQIIHEFDDYIRLGNEMTKY